jgi:ubiquitin C-terminal hydrolase
LNGGHYIGEVMNVDDNQWYDCNDSHVSKIKGGIDKQSTSAYVLFYI